VPSASNILANPGFESGRTFWTFYTNGSGGFSTGTPAYQCAAAARIAINSVGNNMQLYQRGISLKPGTRYRLSFAGYSTAGHDLQVYLHKHTSPYTNYGVYAVTFDLTTSWQVHSIEFTTQGFSSPVSDGRLRFWFVGNAQAGDVYWLDDLVLEEVTAGAGQHSQGHRYAGGHPRVEQHAVANPARAPGL
jgi:hypothetical protein